jgi:ribosomal protein L40E
LQIVYLPYAVFSAIIMGLIYLCRYLVRKRGSDSQTPPPSSQQPDVAPQRPAPIYSRPSPIIPGSKQPIPHGLPTRRQWSASRKQLQVLLCGNCGKMNSPHEESCWQCKEELTGATRHTHSFQTNPHCAVCAFWQYPDDPLSITPCCQAQGHSAHIIDFVRTKNACPSCNQALTQPQLLHLSRKGRGIRSTVDFRFKVLVCSKCKQWNNPQEELCWKCDTTLGAATAQTHATKSITSCVVCGYGVSLGEHAAICPKCHATGHRTHMHEYVKAKGGCPICKLRMRPAQLLITL